MVPHSLKRFLDAMHNKDRAGLEAELSDDVSLASPIVEPPVVVGKQSFPF